MNAFFNNEICQFLITEGNALADRYKGSFMTFSADQYVKCKYYRLYYNVLYIIKLIRIRFAVAFYNPFLKTAWDNKYEVENLHVEESITLDSGEGTLENSVNQMPRPPPRHESYMLSSTLGTDGSGSENYEMLPTRSLNSLNGKLNTSYAPLWCTIVLLLFLSLTHPSLACSFFSRLFAEERDISLDEIYDDNNEKPKHLHQSKFHHRCALHKTFSESNQYQTEISNQFDTSLSLSLNLYHYHPISLSHHEYQTCVYILHKHFKCTSCIHESPA